MSDRRGAFLAHERQSSETRETKGLDQCVVIDRMVAMMTDGVIRRIGVAPNHYAFGMTANVGKVVRNQ